MSCRPSHPELHSQCRPESGTATGSNLLARRMHWCSSNAQCTNMHAGLLGPPHNFDNTNATCNPSSSHEHKASLHLARNHCGNAFGRQQCEPPQDRTDLSAASHNTHMYCLPDSSTMPAAMLVSMNNRAGATAKIWQHRMMPLLLALCWHAAAAALGIAAR